VTQRVGFDRLSIKAAVSRETFARLDIYVDLLLRWQQMMNLVSPATLNDVWNRHIADSLQIYRLAPEVYHWVDLGSGAGFPGLVTAICSAEHGLGKVALVESDKRKCAFLREVVRSTGARAEVFNGRIEEILPQYTGQIGAFSARALAPLDRLLTLVDQYLEKGVVAYFLKGKDYQDELTRVSDLSNYEWQVWPSEVHSEGVILKFGRQRAPFRQMDDC